MHIAKMQTKRLFTLVIIFLFILSTFTVSAKQAKLYMWEITPKNDPSGENIAYVLGTVNVSLDNIYPLNKAIESAYAQSEKLVIDLDPSKILNLQVISSLKKYGMLEQTSIDKILSAQAFKKADDLIKKYTDNKKSLSDYKNFKPWVIDSLIVNLKLNSYNKYTRNGISSYFINKAQKDKKEILKVETLTLQYRLLGTQSFSIQKSKLENTLNNIDSYPATVDKLFNAWQNGDTDNMGDLIFPNFGDNTVLNESYNQMLLERNKRTVDYIKRYLNVGGKYFIVLDASLMAGDKSILKLLADMGYNVEQK